MVSELKGEKSERLWLGQHKGRWHSTSHCHGQKKQRCKRLK